MTVGEDTYVSLVDAETYIAANFSEENAQKIKWDGLTDSVKEAYLKRATIQIDNLLLRGTKVTTSQLLAFPRAINTRLGVVVDDSVPTNVISAQIEQALVIAYYDGDLVSERQKLAQDGVTQFSLGSLSETISLKSSKNTKLKSEYAMELLRDYLLGGVPI